MNEVGSFTVDFQGVPSLLVAIHVYFGESQHNMSPCLLNDALREHVISLAVVFMGSNKYKGENTFDSFLSRHGGQANACTDYEKVHVHV